MLLDFCFFEGLFVDTIVLGWLLEIDGPDSRVRSEAVAVAEQQS